MATTVPALGDEQLRVVQSPSKRLQVIACAGSGKTETMAQRIARLLEEGTPPAAIVAFTFTERAAASLKARVQERCEQRLGAGVTRGLGRLYVGTIHSYCFRLLQERAPECADRDPIDDHRLAALLSREERRLKLKALAGRQWASIRYFLSNLAVVENELIAPDRLTGPFGDCCREFFATLANYRFLTYGGMIAQAVQLLQRPEVAAAAHAELQHLIVDEYQDVNPAQEKLIELMIAGGASLCVVGDDDQAIYQWRGSDIANILGFADRNPGCEKHDLTINRRSRPAIVAAANAFVPTISPRLSKKMVASRPSTPFAPVCWAAETPDDEAEEIVRHIEALHDANWRYRDIAVLYRSVRTSSPPLLAALRRRGIPFNCAGRTGLFLQPEAVVLGKTYAWLAENSWRENQVDLPDLAAEFADTFGLTRDQVRSLRDRLAAWRRAAGDEKAKANLVGDYYEFLRALGVDRWDLADPALAARMASLARFSQLLADFEHAKRRARPVEGRHTGGQAGGPWFYRQLNNYIQFYAFHAYEDSPGEEDPNLDAVDVLTVHQAKGLEWPIVFIPCLVQQRFPSSKAGRKGDWALPEKVFPSAARRRYEGGEMEERRLFYVAITRGREALYLSRFRRKTNRATPSQFYTLLAGQNETGSRLPLPPRPEVAGGDGNEVRLTLAFSDLAAYEECPYGYRLRALLGFEPLLAEELGYGRAVHAVLRRLAETARRTGAIPTRASVSAILDREFYLPFANQPQFENLKAAALRLVRLYVDRYGADLRRTWDTERAFELQIAGGSVTGRADLLLDGEGGEPAALALADYKTETARAQNDVHAFQLAIYAAAARDEGLPVTTAYVHRLGRNKAEREPVAIDQQTVTAAVQHAEELVADIAARRFPPRPEADTCRRCDVRPLCAHAAK